MGFGLSEFLYRFDMIPIVGPETEQVLPGISFSISSTFWVGKTFTMMEAIVVSQSSSGHHDMHPESLEEHENGRTQVK